MDLGVLLESPQGNQTSSRVGACTCAFLPSCRAGSRIPSRGSRDLWLSLEAFPRGFPMRFPTGLSHVPPWCESILGMKVQEVQGKQFPLEWTDIFGGLLEWWHDPGVPLAFLVERASSSDATGTSGILSRPRRERIPPLELGGGNGAPLDVGATLVLPLEWRRVCRGTS